MRKTLLTGLITTALVMTSFQVQITQAAAQDNDYMEVRFPIGQQHYITDSIKHNMDAAPYIENGRTFVPVRYLGDSLNAETNYDSGIVTVSKAGKEVQLTIGQKALQVDGANRNIDVAPVVKNGRTYLPARYVAEAFGYEVGFANNTVTVTKPQPIATGPFEPTIQRLDMKIGSTVATATKWDGTKVTVNLDAAPVVIYPAQKYVEMAWESGYLPKSIEPIIDNNVTRSKVYIPFKSAAKAFGVPAQNIKWDGKTLKVYREPDLYLSFTEGTAIGSNSPQWGGKLSSPAKIIDGELMFSTMSLEGLLFKVTSPSSFTTGFVDTSYGEDIPTGTVSLACNKLE